MDRRSSEPAVLLAGAAAGDRAALARLLSLVERGGDPAREVARAVAARPVRQADTIGITGAPGAGKSTLTSALISVLRGRGQEVAVLAIDPTSPYTGGAILGDRVRMQDHSTDDGVFIRSMATRGHLGGLSLATPEAIRVLAAAGRDLIVVETVGVGQVEVDIAGAADTTVVVLNPGWGDSVQANKAGLLEIADVFAVNKADRPGADRTVREVATMLDLTARDHEGWRPPVVPTVATSGEGVAELVAALDAHRAHITASGELARRREQRVRAELREIVARRLEQRARAATTGGRWEQIERDVVAGRSDPWTAADELLGPLDG